MNEAMLESDPVLSLAVRFFRAIENGDMDIVREIYSPDAIVWHNYDALNARFAPADGKVVSDNIALLSLVQSLIPGFKYEVWHLEKTESGFLQQHLVTGRSVDGAPVRFPVCVVCKVEAERITSLYEYLDVNQLPKTVLSYFAESRTM